ncbi:succinyl-diaminopimelate desuccinylase [Bacillus thermophilus]|uniref:Probable succinyl-diaminopimelate desuccinylase n=1 Tax=Siminovitchia thermophila TaxID=1245522 RepID=A0ABS2R719_9BACI|nr:M20 family metallopeptidase [Siminovitchia thermophila]MBM7715200.1 succinyl-diaminopimelate desuccinylase [Siminovitchia thermophila]
MKKAETTNRILKSETEEVILLTQALVRIPSVYRPGEKDGNEERVARFVYNYLKKNGVEVHIEEVEPGRPNVIGIIDSGKPGKTLLFEGHTDVVTEGKNSSWTYDPFGAEIVNGKMYGRGTNDTKGNLACMMTAGLSLHEEKENWSGKIILCIPCDEEGMMIGIKDFIKRGWAKDVDGAIICEPLDKEVCITQKGAMRVIIRTYGKMAHGAMPLSGINPNLRMARIICELHTLEEKEKQHLGKHPMLGYPSITPTILQAPVAGEAQINVMPDECMTTLDIRTIPGQNHKELEHKIQAIFDHLAKDDPDFKATYEVIEDRPWTETPIDDPLVKSVSQAVTEVLKKPATYNGVPGATDGTFLHLEGIPIVTIGAGDREIPHQIDEYVEVEDLVIMTEIYRRAALLFLQES